MARIVRCERLRLEYIPPSAGETATALQLLCKGPLAIAHRRLLLRVIKVLHINNIVAETHMVGRKCIVPIRTGLGVAVAEVALVAGRPLSGRLDTP